QPQGRKGARPDHPADDSGARRRGHRVAHGMALAINIRADHPSAGEIERLWDHVAAFEDAPSMRALGYRPHLTFAIYDDIDEHTACEAMRLAATGQTQLRITF